MGIYVVLKSSTVKVYTGYYRATSYQMYSKVSAHEICVYPILACKPYCHGRSDELKEKFKEGVQYQEQRSEVLTDTVSHTVAPSGITDLPNSLTTSVNTSQQVSTSPDSSTCTTDDTDSVTSPIVSRDMSGSNRNRQQCNLR